MREEKNAGVAALYGVVYPASGVGGKLSAIIIAPLPCSMKHKHQRILLPCIITRGQEQAVAHRFSCRIGVDQRFRMIGIECMIVLRYLSTETAEINRKED